MQQKSGCSVGATVSQQTSLAAESLDCLTSHSVLFACWFSLWPSACLWFHSLFWKNISVLRQWRTYSSFFSFLCLIYGHFACIASLLGWSVSVYVQYAIVDFSRVGCVVHPERLFRRPQWWPVGLFFFSRCLSIISNHSAHSYVWPLTPTRHFLSSYSLTLTGMFSFLQLRTPAGESVFITSTCLNAWSCSLVICIYTLDLFKVDGWKCAWISFAYMPSLRWPDGLLLEAQVYLPTLVQA